MLHTYFYVHFLHLMHHHIYCCCAERCPDIPDVYLYSHLSCKHTVFALLMFCLFCLFLLYFFHFVALAHFSHSPRCFADLFVLGVI